MMRSVVHPGPIRPERVDLEPCVGREIEVVLDAGVNLDEAVAKAIKLENVDSAWLEVVDAPVEMLDYVIPAETSDNTHVAWYSDTHRFGKGIIDQLGMIVGHHNGKSFLHGHGLWTADGQNQAMGHILAQNTKLANPIKVRGIGLTGVEFERRYDKETNFELFQVNRLEPAPEGADFAILRLLPNRDFSTAIDDACTKLNWRGARVHGIGSLIGANFNDSRTIDCLPTEFLVTDAVAGIGGHEPEISIVGIDGSKVLSGRLSRGKNAVLVTAELVLSRLIC